MNDEEKKGAEHIAESFREAARNAVSSEQFQRYCMIAKFYDDLARGKSLPRMLVGMPEFWGCAIIAAAIAAALWFR